MICGPGTVLTGASSTAATATWLVAGKLPVGALSSTKKVTVRGAVVGLSLLLA
ncbi:MAG TPA: hypothetical protein VFH48_09395 [Chloroflexota bacterium]|nr:hypothetical protein [Chloroflexota bacterium]